jgi:hypothetical protein
LAETKAMVPTSDEINCAKCHANGGTLTQTFEDILTKHDAARGNSALMDSRPVLCARCHGSPALGSPNEGSSGKYLSAAIHGFHSGLTTQPNCYDCHPGAATACSRSLAHAATDGNCMSCHGDLATVASSITELSRVPWANEPKCGDCHKSTGAATLTAVNASTTSSISQVDTGSALYRNSLGHGGLACSACHSSPHAMVPSREAQDNYQAIAYQGAAVSIGSCAACHGSSKGEGAAEFME